MESLALLDIPPIDTIPQTKGPIAFGAKDLNIVVNLLFVSSDQPLATGAIEFLNTKFHA